MGGMKKSMYPVESDLKKSGRPVQLVVKKVHAPSTSQPAP